MDARKLNNILRELYACATLADVGNFAVGRVSSLFDSDQVVWNHFHSRLGVLSSGLKHQPDNLASLAEATNQFLYQHPWYSDFVDVAKPSFVLRMSDRISDVDYRSTALFQEAYVRLQSEYQIAIGLKPDKASIVGFMICRGRRDFSDADLALLEFIFPHLKLAWKRAAQLEDLQSRVATCVGGAETVTSGKVFATRDGAVRHAEQPARHLLQKYFPEMEDKPYLLPSPIRALLAGRERSVRIKTGPGLALSVAVDDGARGESTIQLQEEAVRPVLDNVRLTGREAEAWRYVAEGKTNEEIGLILGISRRTAEKHVEGLLRKLSVPNRRAAIALWHQQKQMSESTWQA